MESGSSLGIVTPWTRHLGPPTHLLLQEFPLPTLDGWEANVRSTWPSSWPWIGTDNPPQDFQI